MQFVLRFLLVALGLTALAACGSTSNTFVPASELIEHPATYSVSQTGPTTRILSVDTSDHALTLVGSEKVQGVFTDARTPFPDLLSRNGIKGCFQSGNGTVHIRKLVETKEPEPERAEGVTLSDLKRNASGDLHALRGKLRAVLHVGIIRVGDDDAGRFEPGRGNALDAAIREQGAHL